MMNRRHFLNHVAVGSAATMGAMEFLSHLNLHAAEVRKNQKACILIWLGGGPPTIDIWDLKPNSKNGGEFKPISTAGDLQISEHMPKTAQQMKHLSVVRSMSTREADHGRGTYFMHTSFVPNPTVVHPTFGSVVSYELGEKRSNLEIPSFISIGGGGMSPGFLGMSHAPFVVSSTGRIENADMDMEKGRLQHRLSILEEIEDGFIRSKRGDVGTSHKDVYTKAVNLMTSAQMEAFKVADEKPEVRALYAPGMGGTANAGMMARGSAFGDSLLMARRLVEIGVPFIEVRNPNGWDLHNDVFQSLANTNLPVLDAGISGLVTDLEQRGMLQDTAIVVMGEFGRTPRINQNVGRDHWATSWSVMVGGAGLQGGRAIGETGEDGMSIVSESYLPGDIWATVAHALRIPLDTVHTSKRGRPMRLANGGNPIKGLIS